MHTRLDVGILGATGMVGQQFIAFLAGHPWFRVTWLGASQRSEGRPYRDAAVWRLASPIPEEIAPLTVDAAVPGHAPKLVFSALDASVAGEIEAAFAERGHMVVSNARNYRMDPVVPLLVPEVNADHLALLDHQHAAHGWKGRIVTNPNCSTVMLSMALAPLRPFGIRRVMVTTMQAVSGAGYPGVASLDILGNVVPFIDGEEPKMETEPRKILGGFERDQVTLHPMVVSAATNRVPVVNGHTEAVSVELDVAVSEDEIIAAWNTFRGAPQRLGLPSAPPQPIVYRPERNRPQPLLDVERDRGMTVSVGRLRPCPVLGWKFIVLGHNTVRGAAGAAVLNAELLRAEGRLS